MHLAGCWRRGKLNCAFKLTRNIPAHSKNNGFQLYKGAVKIWRPLLNVLVAVILGKDIIGGI